MEKFCLACFIENCRKFEKGMSSIIFSSNQISSRRINEINDFEIELSPPIDARSGKNSIIVEEILYPNTISTIHPRNKEEFQMKVDKFMMKKKWNSCGFKRGIFT